MSVHRLSVCPVSRLVCFCTRRSNVVLRTLLLAVPNEAIVGLPDTRYYNECITHHREPRISTRLMKADNLQKKVMTYSIKYPSKFVTTTIVH